MDSNRSHVSISSGSKSNRNKLKSTNTQRDELQYPLLVHISSRFLSLFDKAILLTQLLFSYFVHFLVFFGKKPRSSSLKPSKNCISLVVISGASSGFGLEISKRLCSLGYVVFSGYRKTSDKQELLEISQKYSRNNGRLIPVKLDVTKSEDINNCYNSVQEYIDTTNGSVLAGVVCNAGSAPIIGLSVAKKEFMQQIFAVNYFGALELAQKAIPLLKLNGGRIIFVGSIAYEGLSRGFGVYTATKSALRQTSLILNAELNEFKVDSVIIEPGLFRTRAIETIESDLDFIKKNENYYGSDSVTGTIKSETTQSEEIAKLNRSLVIKLLEKFKHYRHFAHPPKHVVDHVVYILQAPFVKSTYQIGWDSYMLSIFSFFPEFITNIIRRNS